MRYEKVTNGTAGTEAAGAGLAQHLTREFPGKYLFVCLKGDLGAGKTAFVRGFSSVLSPGSRVKSPSYTVVNEYRGGEVPVFHFDLYRLEDSEEGLEGIGFDDYVKSGHCILEWSEFLPPELRPEGAVDVTIAKTENEDERIITVDY